MSASNPLVSVVTPVFNGGNYLVQCIESVLSQTYDNWEYIIVNNCSTDDSLAIASRYASQDPRIVIINNQDHLSAVANWNFSVTKMSANSKYCKILHADDWLFPECVSKMVELAESNPSVAIVSCYVLLEKSLPDHSKQRSVLNAAILYPSHVTIGREIGRGYMLGTLPVTFTPSCQLIRSDAIRQREILYDESTGVYSALDCQVGLELLKDADFGFVHQVLVCAREHAGSLTSKINRYVIKYPEALRLLKHFGHIYLTEEECDICWKRAISTYSRFLGRSVLALRKADFWRFHRNELRQLGCPIKLITLPTCAVKEVLRLMAQPIVRMERRWPLMKRCQSVSPRRF
jgi:glycosyltransferase involved in cell wall biosynthesis